MKHLAVIVDWYGPYHKDAALQAAQQDWDEGLYLALGKGPYERQSTPQYIGLSNHLAKRLAQNKTLPNIKRDLKIWLGAIGTAGLSGRKVKRTPASLDYAEWAHCYFMNIELRLNKQKTLNPPKRPVTVLN